MFFDAITEKGKRLKGINQNVLINTILNRKEFKDFIIELNTKNQLFDLNIDSKGVSLSTIGGIYSPFTIQESKKPGKTAKKSPSAINLFDTGKYYESHKVTITSLRASFFIMDSDPQKDDSNLFDDWGKEILGLSEDSLERLSKKILVELLPLLIAEI